MIGSTKSELLPAADLGVRRTEKNERQFSKAAAFGAPQIRNQPHPGCSSAASLASISVSGRL